MLLAANHKRAEPRNEGDLYAGASCVQWKRKLVFFALGNSFEDTTAR
jgi:hypothetical protein